MRAWLGRALLSLTVAVSCAKATDEELLGSDDDDDSGGTSSGGFSGTGFGGTASGFGGTSGKGGTGASGGTTTTGGTSGAGGKGGTGGTPTGGTSGDGGASDGGEGGADACTPPTRQPDLRIDYKADARAVTDDPSGQFHVVNGTTEAVPLRELRVRYWFHSEFTCDETTANMVVSVVTFQLQSPFANGETANVTTNVVTLGTGAPGCDGYFDLGFTTAAGSLAPAQYALIGYFAQFRIYTHPHDQSNDFSYGACTIAPVYFDRVTLYRNRVIVSGREPGGGGGEGGAGGEGGGGMGGI